jgi:transposase-like protein
MVEASGGQIAKVARELKLHDSSLGNWVREAREQAAGAPSPAERAEIRDLRVELERVTRERDILGKPSPTSRRRTRRACDHRVHVHRRGAGEP